MSNTERQRRFRERNPGYYGRLHATRRASAQRGAKAILAQLQATTQAAAIQSAPLMLPAPAEPLVFEFTNTSTREMETVKAAQSASDAITLARAA